MPALSVGLPLFLITRARLFMTFPAVFITALAGLALPGTIGRNLTTANVRFPGIGGAIWGAAGQPFSCSRRRRAYCMVFS